MVVPKIVVPQIVIEAPFQEANATDLCRMRQPQQSAQLAKLKKPTKPYTIKEHCHE
jgi:hypothetical protein